MPYHSMLDAGLRGVWTHDVCFGHIAGKLSTQESFCTGSSRRSEVNKVGNDPCEASGKSIVPSSYDR